MKITTIIGLLLVVVGLVSLAYGGLTYTKTETVLDIGPIQATTQRHETIPLPPILGGGLLVAGVVLLMKSGKKGA